MSKICLFCIILLLSVVFLTNLFTFSIDHLSDLDHLVLFKVHNQIMVILSQEKTKSKGRYPRLSWFFIIWLYL